MIPKSMLDWIRMQSPRAGLLPTPTMPTMQPGRASIGLQGEPERINMPRSGSAGLFDQYMLGNMAKKGPRFMPPTLGGLPAASGATPGAVPSFGTNDGGGSGGSGGFESGPTSQSGFSMPSLGVSNMASVLGGLFGGPLGQGLANAAFGPSSNYGIQASLSGLYGLNDATLDEGSMAPGGYGYDAGYGGDSGVGGGGGNSDGAAGPGGNGSAGSDASGGADGPGGSSGGAGDSGDSGDGGWAKGGKVTKKRLRGPNPPGPDDGYGALDAGELVIPSKAVRKLSKQQIAGLLGGR